MRPPFGGGPRHPFPSGVMAAWGRRISGRLLFDDLGVRPQILASLRKYFRSPPGRPFLSEMPFLYRNWPIWGRAQRKRVGNDYGEIREAIGGIQPRQYHSFQDKGTEDSLRSQEPWFPGHGE